MTPSQLDELGSYRVVGPVNDRILRKPPALTGAGAGLSGDDGWPINALAFAIDDAQNLPPRDLDDSSAVRRHHDFLDLARRHGVLATRTSSPIGVGLRPLIGT